MKTAIYAEDVVVAFAARRLGRPVKWIAARLEEFLSATHGRDLEGHAEMAVDANGKVLALKITSDANVGAYATTTGVLIQLLLN